MNPEHTHVDWGQRYREGTTPWDLARAHYSLQAAIESGLLAPPAEGATCFVPGCGRGHDALALARAGWKVTAMDIVADLAGPLGAELEPLGGQFLVGDALRPELGVFDLVWEHTFLCALGPYQRPDWARMMKQSVRSGGLLGAVVFPANKPAELGGPPWGYDLERLTVWLGDGFEMEHSEKVPDELEPRSWEQFFSLFRRA